MKDKQMFLILTIGILTGYLGYTFYLMEKNTITYMIIGLGLLSFFLYIKFVNPSKPLDSTFFHNHYYDMESSLWYKIHKKESKKL